MNKKSEISAFENFEGFINSCNNFCNFIEREDQFDSIDYLARIQKLLLELYLIAIDLSNVIIEDENDDIEIYKRL